MRTEVNVVFRADDKVTAKHLLSWSRRSILSFKLSGGMRYCRRNTKAKIDHLMLNHCVPVLQRFWHFPRWGKVMIIDVMAVWLFPNKKRLTFNTIYKILLSNRTCKFRIVLNSIEIRGIPIIFLAISVTKELYTPLFFAFVSKPEVVGTPYFRNHLFLSFCHCFYH